MENFFLFAKVWLARNNPRRYFYQAKHRYQHTTEYHKPGATHEGGWYDEPTGAWLEVLGTGA